MNPIVLCDFDGTIMGIDTCVFLLETFVTEDWKALDRLYERGEITIEECMQHQMAMLRVPVPVLLRELERVAFIRPHFETLLEHCQGNNIPFIIVSAGLDFVIHHFLARHGWGDRVQVWAAKTTIREDGITLTFPTLQDDTSHDFKEDLVNYHQKHGWTVIYVGNGSSDYHAVRKADLAFVIKDSKLADLCKRNRVSHHEICDFLEVVDTLRAVDDAHDVKQNPSEAS